MVGSVTSIHARLTTRHWATGLLTRICLEGIEGLLRDAKKHGIKFGIWIEPEMTNTTSELYEAHPDWIVKAPKRDAVLGVAVHR